MVSKSPIRTIVRALNDNRAVRAVKNWRNDIIDRSFRASGHAERDRFLERFNADGQAIVFAIAFNTPWVIDLLTASWIRNVGDATLVVVDNSSNAAARQAHAQICGERGIAYVELPRNREWHPNRSHAIAMNWVYYNLVDRLKPDIFGFVDHDCFPIAPVSVRERLEGMSLYGRIWTATRDPAIWYFWAGFGFFRYALTFGRAIDFKHAYEWGADTGGKNWRPVYSKLDRSFVREAESKMLTAGEGAPVERMQVLDDRFNHLGAASYRADLATADRRKAFADFLWTKYLPGQRPLVSP